MKFFFTAWSIVFLIIGLNACMNSQEPSSDVPSIEQLNTSAIQTLTIKFKKQTQQALSPQPSITIAVTTDSRLTPQITGTILQPVPLQQTPTVNPHQFLTPSRIPNCDLAEFIEDLTIPYGSVMTPGFRFMKTWRLKNIGSCTWTNAYYLSFAGGTPFGSDSQFPIANTVLPGETIDLSVTLDSPIRSGIYDNLWVLRNPEGQIISIRPNNGNTLEIKIIVDDRINATKSQSTPVATSEVKETDKCKVSEDKNGSQEILNLVNQERAKHGLILLITQTQLDQVAHEHNSDMVCNGFLGHTGSDDSSLADRLQKYSYISSLAVENLSMIKGRDSKAQDVLDGWLKKRVDQENLLNPALSQVGLSSLTYFENNEKYKYITMLLAKP